MERPKAKLSGKPCRDETTRHGVGCANEGGGVLMVCKESLWCARDPYGAPGILMVRQGSLWCARDPYGAQGILMVRKGAT